MEFPVPVPACCRAKGSQNPGCDFCGGFLEDNGSSQNKQAADCYRKVIEFVRQHPDQYDPDFEKTFQGWVAELDPPAAT